MARTIPQRELRNENAKLMDAVSAGETFIVTRNGEPVAELRPVQRSRQTFISRDDLTRISGAGVRIDPEQFRRDLDDAIDQSL
jgi:prevent-host-death family protein